GAGWVHPATDRGVACDPDPARPLGTVVLDAGVDAAAYRGARGPRARGRLPCVLRDLAAGERRAGGGPHPARLVAIEALQRTHEALPSCSTAHARPCRAQPPVGRAVPRYRCRLRTRVGP